MTITLTHKFVSAIPDGADTSVVRPSNWNDTHDVSGTLPIANGGTNTASVPANGQLLIGNGTDYTVANLTAGTGVTITNTAGGITLSAPDNGTVTGVTASSPLASSGGTAPDISLTGTVPVGNGGTGATTLTGYVIGNGTSAMTASTTIPTSNLTGTLPVANGGTGQTTYTDGQLLIGNTTGNTLAKATLTAGTGVTITNGPGTITISAPDTGTVTAVTASSPLASSGGATPNLSLTGTVAIANGGTAGTATPTAGAVPYGTGTAYAFSAAGTTGQVLTSAGAGAPTWTTPTTGTVTSVTASSPLASSGGATPNLTLGTVPVANGGTNATATPTAGAIAYGTGTAYAFSAAGTTGQVLTSNGAGAPTWAAAASGTVTSVAQSFTGGLISVAGSPITSSGTLALTVAGTSGGVPYFSSGTSWASTAAGTTGQFLKSNGSGAPTWADVTANLTVGSTAIASGTSGYFLYNNAGTLANAATTGSGNVVLATSPSLTTPAIGAATGTSLALGGATIGTNALAVTGTASISGGAYISNLGGANKIINGDMVIDQRNAGASLTVLTSSTYSLDRWNVSASVSSKFSVQQNAAAVTPPAGFTNYLGATSLSSYSVGAGELFLVGQVIEGLNCTDLNWGTANAQTVTMSFWVRSSLTGTFGGSLLNNANNRSYPFTYTISVANTWELKTVTIAGDTSGTWLTTNGRGVQLYFNLGTGTTYSGTAGAWAGSQYYSATGATSVVGTNGATWYVTGVKLEVGTVATPFVPDDYAVSLEKCRRYYQKYLATGSNHTFYVSFAYATTNTIGNFNFDTPMRTAPTFSYSGSFAVFTAAGSNLTVSSLVGGGNLSANTGEISTIHTAGTVAGNASGLSANADAAAYLAWSAEL